MTSVLLTTFASAVLAEPQIYTLDPGHSQAAFQYEHAGFSVTYGMFGGFVGEIVIDRDDLAASSVSVSIAADQMYTGDVTRDEVLLRSGQFFDLGAAPLITFVSTSVLITGPKAALITGDLSLNGVTVSVVLDTVLMGETDAYPFPPFGGQPAVGFTASTVLSRSDFGLGLFTPFIVDEVKVDISIEAMILPQG
ncbi:MAG: polyisoprenoid-binding protein [Rhodobacteraceae bacterium]|nr:polyisoprenoid-binding protein [Paracoccaceae bacterium]